MRNLSEYMTKMHVRYRWRATCKLLFPEKTKYGILKVRKKIKWNRIFAIAGCLVQVCLSHTRTVVREGCKVDDASQWQNWKFDPLPRPKPLNRSSQKVAHLITSWISTDAQNLVTIPPGVSFPRMREIAHQNVYSASFFFGGGVFQRPTA